MRLVLTVLALFSLAGAAAAQSPSPSPRALQLSHQIYEALGGPAQMTAMMDRMMTSAAASLPAATVNGKDVRAEVTASLKTTMARIVPEAVAASERVYAETFTEAQLQDILGFYQSPTGRVFVAKLPEVTARTLTLMAPAIRRMQADLLSHLCDVNGCTPEQRAQMARLTGG